MASIIRIKATGSYRAQVRRKGFEKQTATFATEKEAREWARSIEHKIDRDEDPGANRSLTIHEALEIYRSHRSRPLSDSQNTRIRHLDKHLGGDRVVKLATSDLASFCRYRIEVDGVKPCSTLADVNTLSAAFKFVAGHLDTRFPEVIRASRAYLREQGLIAESVSRDRRPERGELKAVLEHLPNQYHDVLLFAIASSMRRGEIARLQWVDVVEADKAIWVRQRKHPTEKLRNDGLVPLLGAAWTILQRQPRTGERIFLFNPEDYTEAFRAACISAGVENLRGHDLRHEGISRLFEAGLSIPQVQMISGHKTWSQLAKYTNLKPKDLHKVSLPSLDAVVVE